LNQVFDEAAPDDVVIRMAKLELHLTVGAEQDWRARLPDLIRQQLQDQLQPLQQGWQQKQGLESGGRDLPPLEWDHTTLQRHQVDLLLHYLRTGSVPWQATHATPPEIAEMLRQTCQQQWQPLMDYLRHTSESAAFYFRLLQLLPKTEGLSLVNALLEPLPLAWGNAVLQVIAGVLAPEQLLFNAYQQRQLAATFLAESLRYQETHRPPNGMRILEMVLGSAATQITQTFIAALPESSALLIYPYSQPQNHAHSPTLSAPSEDLVPPDWSISSSSPFSSPSFPLSVRYAGLVLLHPFISHFFAAVGVNVTGEKALAAEVIPRAAALLHFLATGTEEIYEYELDLIKVLLGLAPDAPLLVAEGLIQSGDREEASAMLQSVIRYWRALKNTSIAGLRSSFLQRPGLLRQAEEGWRLHVEPQAFDLLLNYLPWAISIVKLPWMPQPIHTEWLTP
jgi:hypothetical protein